MATPGPETRHTNERDSAPQQPSTPGTPTHWTESPRDRVEDSYQRPNVADPAEPTDHWMGSPRDRNGNTYQCPTNSETVEYWPKLPRDRIDDDHQRPMDSDTFEDWQELPQFRPKQRECKCGQRECKCEQCEYTLGPELGIGKPGDPNETANRLDNTSKHRMGNPNEFIRHRLGIHTLMGHRLNNNNNRSAFSAFPDTHNGQANVGDCTNYNVRAYRVTEPTTNRDTKPSAITKRDTQTTTPCLSPPTAAANKSFFETTSPQPPAEATHRSRVAGDLETRQRRTTSKETTLAVPTDGRPIFTATATHSTIPTVSAPITFKPRVSLHHDHHATQPEETFTTPTPYTAVQIRHAKPKNRCSRHRKSQQEKKRTESLQSLQSIFQSEESQATDRERELKRKVKAQVTNWYGFAADPFQSTGANARQYLGSFPPELYFAKPHNTAFHNLCVSTCLPPTIRALLGLGLNFCIRRSVSNGVNALDTDRFQRDAFTRMFFAGAQPLTGTNLFHRTDWQPHPQELPTDFRGRINEFTSALKTEFQGRQRVQSNLLDSQQHSLKWLIDNPELVVFATDKNLGPAITERKTYVERALTDHLADTDTYSRLTATEFETAITTITTGFNQFLTKFFPAQKPRMTPAEKAQRTFLTRSFDAAAQSESPFNYLYLLAKVHKTPWNTRPIVSCSGSLLHGLGRWVDKELQRIVKHLPFYLKSSVDLAHELAKLDPLPPNARFFTCDATAMYTNIDTDHALSEIETFLRQSLIPVLEDVNVDAIIAALRLIMENNVFVFGDTFWHQRTGTAMGTPPAPMYATLYFAIHESKLLHNFPQIRFYRRYIDDGFGIWIGDDGAHWKEFRLAFASFGKLSWTFSTLAKRIDFLDITLEIDATGSIDTTLFEKALNLYLYLPPHSAHPPGGLKGLVFGWFFRLQRLVSNPALRLTLADKLRLRLLVRGYTPEQLDPLFCEARSKCFSGIPKTLDATGINPLFLHVNFHPADPSARIIQRLVRRYLLSPQGDLPIHALRNYQGFEFGVNRIIVAYHRPRNLKNYLAPRRLNPLGTSVSSIVEAFHATSKT
jgi:hypothetical protein